MNIVFDDKCNTFLSFLKMISGGIQFEFKFYQELVTIEKEVKLHLWKPAFIS